VRITREKLIELALKETEARAERSSIVSGYLIGSVAASRPLVGGTGDIDLILIDELIPEPKREMVSLSPDIHLDITIHPKELYAKPKELRVHPWLGPSMCEPVFLFDPEHYFEWAQAGARGQFHRADHIQERAAAFLNKARKRKAALPTSSRWLGEYLRALMEGANAAATLGGFPLTGRRIALELEIRSEHIGMPELYSTFQSLSGNDHSPSVDIPLMLAEWAKAFDLAALDSAEPELDPCRRDYHLRAYQALIEVARPESILWPLLRIWDITISELSKTHPRSEYLSVWSEVLKQLRLAPSHRDHREDALEGFLDIVETKIDHWSESGDL
jgi:hypothetical protein